MLNWLKQRPLLLAPLGLAGLYVAAMALIGSRVAAEMERLEALLVARDDVTVLQFDYTHGLRGGELVYRLRWQPARALPAAEPLLEALALADERMTLADTLQVQHGPWFGGIGFGLARVNLELALPAALRDALPQYPGKDPLLSFTGTLGFGGELHAALAVQDYDGRLIYGGSVADLQSYGIGAELRADAALTRIDMTLELPLLELAMPDAGRVAVEGLRSTHEFSFDDAAWQLATQVAVAQLQASSAGDGSLAKRAGDPASYVPLLSFGTLAVDLALTQRSGEPLLGDSSLALGSLQLTLPEADLSLALSDYVTSSHVGLLDDTVENTGTISIGAIEVNKRLLGGLDLETSIRGISSSTYAALESLWSGAWSEAAMDVAMTDALQALVAEQIVFNIDRLVLRLPAEEDLNASMSVIYAGSPTLDSSSPAALLAALNVEATVDGSVAALERTLDATDLPSAQEDSAREWLDAFYDLPYIQVEDGRVRTSLQLANSAVTVNGEPLELLSQWLAQETVAPAGKKELAQAAGPLCPDYNLDGTALAYSSDDLYAAQSFDVVAGGPSDLGECLELPGTGYVAAAPDFTLEFYGSAAGRALEFRVNSSCDSVLLINDPQGTWHFDDDSNGAMDALLRFPKASAGSWDIWVGSLENAGCGATLTLETF